MYIEIIFFRCFYNCGLSKRTSLKFHIKINYCIKYFSKVSKNFHWNIVVLTWALAAAASNTFLFCGNVSSSRISHWPIVLVLGTWIFSSCWCFSWAYKPTNCVIAVAIFSLTTRHLIISSSYLFARHCYAHIFAIFGDNSVYKQFGAM